MALSIDDVKLMVLPNNLTDNKKSSDGQPTFGVRHTGNYIYDIVELIVDDLDVGTATLVSNTLVDNGNGTYTWTPIAGSSFLINTHALTNPINTIVGLAASDVQTALEQLYLAVSTNGGFAHPAVTTDAFSNPALSVDLVTQVATLDFDADDSFPVPTTFLGSNFSIQDWFLEMEQCVVDLKALTGAPNAQDLGTFTGTIITDNVSITQALQELENAIVTGNVASTSTYTDNGDGTYTMDNNSIVTPSVLTIDLQAVNLPLTTDLTFDFTSIGGGNSTATTVQGALDQLLMCCENHLGILNGTGGTGVTLGGGVTTAGIYTSTGLGLLPATFNIVDGFTALEIAVADRKPIDTSVGTNPALTIDDSAALLDKIDLDLTASGSYENAGRLLLVDDNIQGAIDTADTEIAKTRTAIVGVGSSDSDLGTFTGVTITDNVSVKQALQELETNFEAIAHTTSTITDNADGTYTHNDGLGTLVTIDTNATSSNLTAIVGLTATTTQAAISELLDKHTDIATLLGATGTDLGTFSGTTIADNSSVKQSLQSLELALEAITTYTSTIVDNTDGTYTHDDGNGNTTVIDTNANTSVVAASGNLTSTNVQNALYELQADIDALSSHDAVTLGFGSDTRLTLSAQELILDLTDLDDFATLSGLPTGSTDLGAFTGTTIADNLDIKEALQSLETAVEAVSGGISAVAFVPSTGVFTHSDGNGITANFTFNALNTPFTATGNTSSTNVQAAIVELQTELDSITGATSVLTDNADNTFVHNDGAAVPTAVTIDFRETAIIHDNVTSGLTATTVKGAIDEIDGNVDNLIALTGVALDAVDLGTFTGTTIADNSTIKVALQALEDATLTADNGLTPLAVVGAPDKIQLGGALTQSTTVDSAAFQLFLQDTPGVHQLQIDNATAALRGTNAALELTGGTFNVKTNGYTGAGNTYTTAGRILQNVNITTGESEYTPYAMPLADGTVGQELVTDGAGNVTWRTRPETVSFQEFLRVESLSVRAGESLWAVPPALDGWQLQGIKSIVATTGANDFTFDFILGGVTQSLTHTGGTQIVNFTPAQTVAEDDLLETNVTAVGASAPLGWTVILTFNRIA